MAAQILPFRAARASPQLLNRPDASRTPRPDRANTSHFVLAGVSTLPIGGTQTIKLLKKVRSRKCRASYGVALTIVFRTR